MLIFTLLPQLKKEITKFNLSEIANKLRETSDSIPQNNPTMSEVRTSLRNQALHLRTYQENLVDPMTEQTIEMIDLTLKLDESFKFGKNSFNEGIQSISDEIELAKHFIDTEATTYVRDVSLLLKINFIQFTYDIPFVSLLMNYWSASFEKSIHMLTSF